MQLTKSRENNSQIEFVHLPPLESCLLEKDLYRMMEQVLNLKIHLLLLKHSLISLLKVQTR